MCEACGVGLDPPHPSRMRTWSLLPSPERRPLSSRGSHTGAGGGTPSVDCGKCALNTSALSDYKPASLTPRVSQVYRRAGGNVGKVATDRNLTSGRQFVGVATSRFVDVVTWLW